MFEALVRGLVLGLLLSISVGPVVFSILKQSINNGHKGGISFILGVSFSDILLVVLCNTFTETFDSIKKYSNEIGAAGSILLIVMGIYFLFFKKVELNEEGVQLAIFRKRDYVRTFLSGFFMNILNPAVIAFWFTWATAFVTMKLPERTAVFATCLLIVLAGDFAKVFLANKIRTRLTAHNILLINRISGLILVGFGVVLLYSIFVLKHTPTH